MNSIRRRDFLRRAAAPAIALPWIVRAADTPSPALLVLNKEEATLAIVDPETKTVVGRVPTGESPHEVTASYDGRFAFAANYGGRTPGHTISMIDLRAHKELRRVDLGVLQRPHGIFFADGKVYFTAQENKLIGRYDPESDRVDWLLGTGQNVTHMILVSKDTNRIFTTNIGSNSVCIIEQSGQPTAWSETVVPVGKGPEAIDLSPDEKEIWTAHSRDGGVSIIDVAEKKVVHRLDVHTNRSNRLKFTRDGARVLISDMGGGELVVVDAAKRQEIHRMKMGRSPEGILIAPDGERAFVAVAGENRVVILDLKKLEVTGHILTGSGPDGMA
ncbi:MAG: cytochrome D1 domain-containing protein, partial [Bryobacteraceae bacterium]